MHSPHRERRLEAMTGGLFFTDLKKVKISEFFNGIDTSRR